MWELEVVFKGKVAQWSGICLVCARLWILSLVLKRNSSLRLWEVTQQLSPRQNCHLSTAMVYLACEKRHCA